MENTIYYLLNEHELELVEELSKITMIDYELKGNMFPMDSLIPLLEDLKCELDRKDEEIENLKSPNEYEEDNYEDYKLGLRSFE